MVVPLGLGTPHVWWRAMLEPRRRRPAPRTPVTVSAEATPVAFVAGGFVGASGGRPSRLQRASGGDPSPGNRGEPPRFGMKRRPFLSHRAPGPAPAPARIVSMEHTTAPGSGAGGAWAAMD